MKTNILKLAFLMVFVFGAMNVNANTCSINRSLGLGSRGSDVACLQQYLRNSGYGYVNPDGVYGPITMQAVMSWQAQNGIYPASGYFDNASRTRFSSTTWTTTYDYGSYGSVLGASIDLYPYSSYSGEERAKMMLEDALEMIEEAKDEIDDSNKNTNDAEEYLEDAENDLFDAIRAFIFDKDFADAYDYAHDAYQNAEDAIDEVDGDSDRDQARDAIEDAEDAISDAEDMIEDRADSGYNVDDAEDLLEDAMDALDDAEDEFDDGDYDEAEDLADEARDLAEEAMDELY